MKLVPVAIAALGTWVLAGCQDRPTLEEAQALCTKQGGFLVIIHSQKITASGGIGPDVQSPGDCVSPNKFDVTQPTPNGAPAPSAAARP